MNLWHWHPLGAYPHPHPDAWTNLHGNECPRLRVSPHSLRRAGPGAWEPLEVTFWNSIAQALQSPGETLCASLFVPGRLPPCNELPTFRVNPGQTANLPAHCPERGVYCEGEPAGLPGVVKPPSLCSSSWQEQPPQCWWLQHIARLPGSVSWPFPLPPGTARPGKPHRKTDPWGSLSSGWWGRQGAGLCLHTQPPAV